ncbi:MAG: hypothetical protein Q9M91_02600 [Candidatus Dojkabacteria bacterium]|nr:hypothetical protein [Candidatus Dojkabacteria bacterium]
MYLKTDTKTIDFDNQEEVSKAYQEGYLLTRLGKERGVVNQTRSIRINLENFEFTSENRRVLRKTEDLELHLYELPYKNYSWEIHKMGKDFYDFVSGAGTMSASKIKSMFTKPEIENPSYVFVYKKGDEVVGYCLSYINDSIVHYSYPFYNLDLRDKKFRMGMILKALESSIDNKKKYFLFGVYYNRES